MESKPPVRQERGPTRRKLLASLGWISAEMMSASAPRSVFAAAWPSPIQAEAARSGATFVTSTKDLPWQIKPLRAYSFLWDGLDLRVLRQPVGPPIEGFGACFNELGWQSLSKLSAGDRDGILAELFAPGKGANFTNCRMPIGANDFARGWYSYDESAGDFDMRHFSLANDRETLLPFLRAARQQNNNLRLWASPWSPPQWMKTNGHYAEAEQTPGRPTNNIRSDQLGHEGQDMFIQEERYFRSYARYFGRFIDAYRQEGIEIGTVMPQNEFNSAQPFPSCTWTPEGLARFLKYLGPEMDRRHVEIFFGTLERADPALLDRVLADPAAARYIKGVGMQWAGKGAVHAIHAAHPELRIYGSEQECGDGDNDWTYAGYCWRLMKHYFDAGACAYMYWNLSLETGGLSHWGWPQNSLITVDAATESFRYNHEFYILKHASHFVQNGAQRLATDGTLDDVLAFGNPDGSYAVLMRNEAAAERPLDLHFPSGRVSVTLAPDSLSTLHVPASCA